MAGKTSWVGMAGWAARAEHGLRVCGPTPSAATFARVLAALDPAALQAALDRWITARLAARPRAPTAPRAAPRDERRTPPQAGPGGRQGLRGAPTPARPV